MDILRFLAVLIFTQECLKQGPQHMCQKENTYVQSIEKVRYSSVMASWRFRLLGSYVWNDSGLHEPLMLVHGSLEV